MQLELDVSAMLKPFDGDFRGGMDLRDSDDPRNLYRTLRDLRKSARDEEKQSDIDSGAAEPSAKAKTLWQEVWEKGQEYLSTVAKDIEIVAYMVEASVRLGGYGGLSTSLQLTRELLEGFWGELLPTPDEDGVGATILPLSRMDNEVITYPLVRVPLTDSRSLGPFVLWQYENARRLESMSADEREKYVSRGAVTLTNFRDAVADTPTPFLKELIAEVQSAGNELKLLKDKLTDLVGEELTPSFRRFQDALTSAENVVKELAGSRLEVIEEAAANDTGVAVTTGPAAPGSSSAGSAVASRAQALDQLERIAVWFEQHEPQSILPLEIRKAIRRARMSPQELYAELIGDQEVRRQLYKDLGIVVSEE